LGVELVHFKKL